MKLSSSWLLSLAKVELTIEALCEQLTMLGLEVEACATAAPPFTKVVVGEIVEAIKHPEADRLKVCTVNVGAPMSLNIVCGGVNARAGIRVAVATVGAVLPGNFTIKEAKLRGVPSHGMLCAEEELGLPKTIEGIMELANDAPIGKDVRDYLKLDDHIISLNITPNRGDCLSMAGLARDLAAKHKQEFKLEKIKAVSSKAKDKIKVMVEETEACPVYCARIIKNIDNAVKTPDDIRIALNQAGIRSISPVVDILNYVMLYLGQPMHAFDRAKVEDHVKVRFAKPKETLQLLNGDTIELKENVLVISDAHKALAMAGIMGGKNSEVEVATKEIILEAAYFAPKFITGRARAYGLHTESSQRFERGVDPELAESALELATKLILEICGGEAGEVVKVNQKKLERPEIVLDYAKQENLLGQAVEPDEVIEILTHLGCKILKKNKHGLKLMPPSWRFDLNIPEDLIEEVARIHGYEHFVPQVPMYSVSVGHRKEIQNSLNSLKAFLSARGLREVISFSFLDPKEQAAWSDNKQALNLINPISSDLAQMRLSIIPSLIKVLQYNERRQIDNLRMFEVGRIYEEQAGKVIETPMLAGLLYGVQEPENWYGSKPLDFYDLKGLIEALFQFTDVDFHLKTENLPAWLHPGQSAAIWAGGQAIGYLGALHPQCQAHFDLKTTPFIFELKLEALSEGYLPKAKAISKYPSIRRDLALVVPEHHSSEQIIKTIVEVPNEILVDTFIFDVYQGAHVAPGTKSIAVALILQHDDHTLVDAEVEHYLQQLVAHLNKKLSASLRN